MPPQRGQGQWALGYREPLNPNERMKKDSDGLEVRQRILDIYSKTGFDGIDPADLRGRMRWIGLYTQRAPGIPGGRPPCSSRRSSRTRTSCSASASTAARCPARRCAPIAGISTEFGRDVADVTDRQNVQLHWIRIEDVPEIWRRLEAVGLDTTEACGDTPRVMLGCPLAGILEDEVLDATPALARRCATVRRRPGVLQPAAQVQDVDLRLRGHCTDHEINDVSFVGVLGADGDAGYDLWVGGGLSTNPKFAQRLGVFVEPDQVAEVWAGVHRRSSATTATAGPAQPRPDEVPHGRLGPGEVPPGAGEGVPARAAARRAGRRPRQVSDQRDHVGVTEQDDGRLRGRLRAARRPDQRQPADPDRRPRRRVRRRPDPDHRAAEAGHPGRARRPRSRVWSARWPPHDLQVRPSAFRRGHDGLHRHRVLQAGDRRDQAARPGPLRGAGAAAARLRRADQHQRQRLPQLLRPVPDRRHRLQGLDGARRRTARMVEGYQVHLGGHLGDEAAFGRKFRGQR